MNGRLRESATGIAPDIAPVGSAPLPIRLNALPVRDGEPPFPARLPERPVYRSERRARIVTLALKITQYRLGLPLRDRA